MSASAAVNACAAYARVDFDARVQGSASGQLVSILYEELDKVLGLIAHAIAHHLDAQMRTAKVRFLTVIHGLESGLDYDNGGEVAAALGQAYRAIRAQTMRAIDMMDTALIDIARSGASDIASAWAAIQRP